MLIVDTGDGPRGGESPAGSSPRVATAGEATRVPARPRRGVCAGEARAGTRVTRDRERARPGPGSRDVMAPLSLAPRRRLWLLPAAAYACY